MVKYEGDKDMPRNTNLDFIKCIACIGVVGLHSVGMINCTNLDNLNKELITIVITR